MPTVFAGDELGSIKRISYAHSEDGWKPLSTTLSSGDSEGKGNAVQKLVAFSQEDSHVLLAAARADGRASVLALAEDGNTTETVSEWTENRLKSGQRYVGIAAAASGIYSCTSNGALRLTKPNGDDTPDFQLAILPMRLAEWRLTSDCKAFAYVGDEVEASVWDSERCFVGASTGQAASVNDAKKRKRSEQLLPGETWRAKNLPNDELNLRQPVRNTAFAFLPSSANSSHQQLLVGTQIGDVRRYDPRVARRPVSNWKGIGKTGGVGTVDAGSHEHEAFVSDKGSNLFAIDMRIGKVSYGYKGLSGAVTSLATTSSYLVSSSEDRFLRLHSTFPPPTEAGQRQESRGEVLDEFYMKVIPTVITVDPSPSLLEQEADMTAEEEEEGDDDEVWAGMEDADSGTEDPTSRRKQKAKSVNK